MLPKLQKHIIPSALLGRSRKEPKSSPVFSLGSWLPFSSSKGSGSSNGEAGVAPVAVDCGLVVGEMTGDVCRS